jgi:hypothetical protein
VIVESSKLLQLLGRHRREVGLTRQPTTQATNGVLNTSFLPRLVGIAEVGLDAQGLAKKLVLSELGAIIEGDALAQLLG